MNWAWVVDVLVQEAPIWLFYGLGTGIAATVAQNCWRCYKDRPYRGWNLEIVRPDGTRVDAMKLSVNEVRSFEESEFERVKWVKSAVSSYGTLVGVALPELEHAGWFSRDAHRRTYVVDLPRAVRSGHVRPYGTSAGTKPLDDEPTSDGAGER